MTESRSPFKTVSDWAFSKLSEKTHQTVRESSLPTHLGSGYDSSAGVFGGKVEVTGDGKVIYNMTGLTSRFDRWGDDQLRRTDEHVITQPRKVVSRLLSRLEFKGLAYVFFPHSMRRRGSKEEIAANARRLGLDSVYGLHDKGIEILKPEVYTNGYPLQDIFRQDVIGHSSLEKIDRQAALVVAAGYLGEVHSKYGCIGEVLPNDIIFQQQQGRGGETAVSNPILNLPDIVYNPLLFSVGEKKKTDTPAEADEVGQAVREEPAIRHPETSRLVTDLMDFIFSMSLEEVARVSRDTQGNNGESLHQTIMQLITNILTAYAQKYGENSPQTLEHTLLTLQSFVKRGRMTTIPPVQRGRLSSIESGEPSLLKKFFFGHNKARLENYNAAVYEAIRPAAEEAISQVLQNVVENGSQVS